MALTPTLPGSPRPLHLEPPADSPLKHPDLAKTGASTPVKQQPIDTLSTDKVVEPSGQTRSSPLVSPDSLPSATSETQTLDHLLTTSAVMIRQLSDPNLGADAASLNALLDESTALLAALVQEAQRDPASAERCQEQLSRLAAALQEKGLFPTRPNNLDEELRALAAHEPRITKLLSRMQDPSSSLARSLEKSGISPEAMMTLALGGEPSESLRAALDAAQGEGAGFQVAKEAIELKLLVCIAKRKAFEATTAASAGTNKKQWSAELKQEHKALKADENQAFTQLAALRDARARSLEPRLRKEVEAELAPARALQAEAAALQAQGLDQQAAAKRQEADAFIATALLRAAHQETEAHAPQDALRTGILAETLASDRLPQALRDGQNDIPTTLQRAPKQISIKDSVKPDAPIEALLDVADARLPAIGSIPRTILLRCMVLSARTEATAQRLGGDLEPVAYASYIEDNQRLFDLSTAQQLAVVAPSAEEIPWMIELNAMAGRSLHRLGEHMSATAETDAQVERLEFEVSRGGGSSAAEAREIALAKQKQWQAVTHLLEESGITAASFSEKSEIYQQATAIQYRGIGRLQVPTAQRTKLHAELAASHAQTIDGLLTLATRQESAWNDRLNTRLAVAAHESQEAEGAAWQVAMLDSATAAITRDKNPSTQARVARDAIEREHDALVAKHENAEARSVAAEARVTELRHAISDSRAKHDLLSMAAGWQRGAAEFRAHMGWEPGLKTMAAQDRDLRVALAQLDVASVGLSGSAASLHALRGELETASAILRATDTRVDMIANAIRQEETTLNANTNELTALLGAAQSRASAASVTVFAAYSDYAAADRSGATATTLHDVLAHGQTRAAAAQTFLQQRSGAEGAAAEVAAAQAQIADTFKQVRSQFTSAIKTSIKLREETAKALSKAGTELHQQVTKQADGAVGGTTWLIGLAATGKDLEAELVDLHSVALEANMLAKKHVSDAATLKPLLHASESGELSDAEILQLSYAGLYGGSSDLSAPAEHAQAIRGLSATLSAEQKQQSFRAFMQGRDSFLPKSLFFSDLLALQTSGAESTQRLSKNVTSWTSPLFWLNFGIETGTQLLLGMAFSAAGGQLLMRVPGLSRLLSGFEATNAHYVARGLSVQLELCKGVVTIGVMQASQTATDSLLSWLDVPQRSWLGKIAKQGATLVSQGVHSRGFKVGRELLQSGQKESWKAALKRQFPDTVLEFAFEAPGNVGASDSAMGLAERLHGAFGARRRALAQPSSTRTTPLDAQSAIDMAKALSNPAVLKHEAELGQASNQEQVGAVLDDYSNALSQALEQQGVPKTRASELADAHLSSVLKETLTTTTSPQTQPAWANDASLQEQQTLSLLLGTDQEHTAARRALTDTWIAVLQEQGRLPLSLLQPSTLGAGPWTILRISSESAALLSPSEARQLAEWALSADEATVRTIAAAALESPLPPAEQLQLLIIAATDAALTIGVDADPATAMQQMQAQALATEAYAQQLVGEQPALVSFGAPLAGATTRGVALGEQSQSAQSLGPPLTRRAAELKQTLGDRAAAIELDRLERSQNPQERALADAFVALAQSGEATLVTAGLLVWTKSSREVRALFVRAADASTFADTLRSLVQAGDFPLPLLAPLLASVDGPRPGGRAALSQQTLARALNVLQQLKSADPSTHALVMKLLELAPTNRQRELLMLSIAARGGVLLAPLQNQADSHDEQVALRSASLRELSATAKAWRALSDAQLEQAISPASGQYFTMSCVPASYVIVAGRRDPVLAYQLRSDPHVFAQLQERFLNELSGTRARPRWNRTNAPSDQLKLEWATEKRIDDINTRIDALLPANERATAGILRGQRSGLFLDTTSQPPRIKRYDQFSAFQDLFRVAAANPQARALLPEIFGRGSTSEQFHAFAFFLCYGKSAQEMGSLVSQFGDTNVLGDARVTPDLRTSDQNIDRVRAALQSRRDVFVTISWLDANGQAIGGHEQVLADVRQDEHGEWHYLLLDPAPEPPTALWISEHQLRSQTECVPGFKSRAEYFNIVEHLTIEEQTERASRVAHVDGRRNAFGVDPTNTAAKLKALGVDLFAPPPAAAPNPAPKAPAPAVARAQGIGAPNKPEAAAVSTVAPISANAMHSAVATSVGNNSYGKASVYGFVEAGIAANEPVTLIAFEGHRFKQWGNVSGEHAIGSAYIDALGQQLDAHLQKSGLKPGVDYVLYHKGGKSFRIALRGEKQTQAEAVMQRLITDGADAKAFKAALRESVAKKLTPNQQRLLQSAEDPSFMVGIVNTSQVATELPAGSRSNALALSNALLEKAGQAAKHAQLSRSTSIAEAKDKPGDGLSRYSAAAIKTLTQKGKAFVNELADFGNQIHDVLVDLAAKGNAAKLSPEAQQTLFLADGAKPLPSGRLVIRGKHLSRYYTERLLLDLASGKITQPLEMIIVEGGDELRLLKVSQENGEMVFRSYAVDINDFGAANQLGTQVADAIMDRVLVSLDQALSRQDVPTADALREASATLYKELAADKQLAITGKVFAEQCSPDIVNKKNGDKIRVKLDGTWLNGVLHIAPNGTMKVVLQMPSKGMISLDAAIDLSGRVPRLSFSLPNVRTSLSIGGVTVRQSDLALGDDGLATLSTAHHPEILSVPSSLNAPKAPNLDAFVSMLTDRVVEKQKQRGKQQAILDESLSYTPIAFVTELSLANATKPNDQALVDRAKNESYLLPERRRPLPRTIAQVADDYYATLVPGAAPRSLTPDEILASAIIEPRATGKNASPIPQTSADFYRRVGLGPKTSVSVDGVTFHLSAAYQSGNRLAVVAYVEHEGTITLRSFYRSESRGVWQCASHHGGLSQSKHGGMHIDERFIGKGGGAKTETVVSDDLQSSLNALAMNPPLVLPDVPELRNVVAGKRSLSNEGIDLTPVSTGDMAFYGPLEWDVSSNRDKVIPQGSRQTPLTAGKKSSPETVSILNQACAPDFSKATGPTRMHLQKNYYPNPVDKYVVPSKDGEVLYTFYTDGDIVWCAAVEHAKSDMTSLGVRRQGFDAEALVTPPVEYEEMLPRGYAGAPIPNPKNPKNPVYHRVDRSWFLKVPVLVEARSALLGL